MSYGSIYAWGNTGKMERSVHLRCKMRRLFVTSFATSPPPPPSFYFKLRQESNDHSHSSRESISRERLKPPCAYIRTLCIHTRLCTVSPHMGTVYTCPRTQSTFPWWPSPCETQRKPRSCPHSVPAGRSKALWPGLKLSPSRRGKGCFWGAGRSGRRRPGPRVQWIFQC